MNNRRRSNGVNSSSSPTRVNGAGDVEKPSNGKQHHNGSPARRRSLMAPLLLAPSAGRSKLSLVWSLGLVAALAGVYMYDRSRHYIPIQPPKSMTFRGKKSFYQSVPPESRRTFHIPDGTKFRRTVARAFRHNGFRKMDKPEDANFIIDKGEDPRRYPHLLPWQRYNNSKFT